MKTFDQYTWPEIRDLPKDDLVAVIPIGVIEEHGHHLPLDTGREVAGAVV